VLFTLLWKKSVDKEDSDAACGRRWWAARGRVRCARGRSWATMAKGPSK